MATIDVDMLANALKLIETTLGNIHEITKNHTRQLTDAERRIEGIAEELTKTNKRMDDLVADREKHQRRLDDRLEEVIEATQEAEKAFLVRIERAEKKRDAAYGEIAKLKRAAKGDQD